MSDQSLAKVGDVIEHGQDIPANVRELTDAQGDDWAGDDARDGGATNASWWPMTVTRVARAPQVVEFDPEPQPAVRESLTCWSTSAHAAHEWDNSKGTWYCTGKYPESVAPDPQPAEPKADHPYAPRVGSIPGCNGRAGAADGKPCELAESEHLSLKEWNRRAFIARGCCGMTAVHMAYCPQFTEDDLSKRIERPAADEDPRYAPMTDEQQRKAFGDKPVESGPLVLSLPPIPPGSVALVGNKTGRRYTLDSEGLWCTRGYCTSYVGVFAYEDGEGVTVEFAPPREPRVWERLDNSDDTLPDVVEVYDTPDANPSIWTWDNGRGLYGDGCGLWHSFTELRELGDVREVLT